MAERNLAPGNFPKRMLGPCPRALDPHKRGGSQGDCGLLATKAAPQSRAGLGPGEGLVLIHLASGPIPLALLGCRMLFLTRAYAFGKEIGEGNQNQLGLT